MCIGIGIGTGVGIGIGIGIGGDGDKSAPLRSRGIGIGIGIGTGISGDIRRVVLTLLTLLSLRVSRAYIATTSTYAGYIVAGTGAQFAFAISVGKRALIVGLASDSRSRTTAELLLLIPTANQPLSH